MLDKLSEFLHSILYHICCLDVCVGIHIFLIIAFAAGISFVLPMTCNQLVLLLDRLRELDIRLVHHLVQTEACGALHVLLLICYLELALLLGWFIFAIGVI